MELLASLFIGKQQNIIAVAIVFLTGHLALRLTALGIARHPRPLLIASTAWGLYGYGSGWFRSKLRKRTSGSTFS